MRSLRLVLIRWRGDVIAARTERAGRPARTAADLTGCDGVEVETHDVNEYRRSFGRRRLVDEGVAAGVGIALALHLLAGVVVLGASLHWHAPSAEEEDRERAAMIRDVLTRIAAHDGDQSRDEHREAAVDEKSAQVVPDKPVPPAPRATEAERHMPRARPPAAIAAAPAAIASTSSAAQGSGGTSNASTSPAVCAAPKSSATNVAMCTRSVVVDSISVMAPECFTDTVVSRGQRGTLTFACDGEGPATAVFGAHSFVGAVHEGKLDACTGTEYPWNDGCRWTSAQRLSGSISSGTLAFSYREAPRAGDHDCLPACWARGTASVAP